MRAGDQALVIENAQVVTPEETLEGASLKIESGMIAEIKAGKINSGAPRLDARGDMSCRVSLICTAMRWKKR